MQSHTDLSPGAVCNVFSKTESWWSMDFGITCVNKDVNFGVYVCFFILIKTTVTVSVDWNMAEVFPFADLHAQADGRCFLSGKFRSGSSLNNPLFGVHKLATIYSSWVDMWIWEPELRNVSIKWTLCSFWGLVTVYSIFMAAVLYLQDTGSNSQAGHCAVRGCRILWSIRRSGTVGHGACQCCWSGCSFRRIQLCTALSPRFAAVGLCGTSLLCSKTVSSECCPFLIFPKHLLCKTPANP